MVTQIDLSVVLTAHDETLVSGPTVSSANAAITMAEAAGITVERLIVLDRPTDATKAWFGQAALDPWDRRTLDQGDLGLARNEIVPLTKGRYIAFLDADDLFSENWLVRGIGRLRQAESAGIRAIVHPEVNWLFDGTTSVFSLPEQDDPLFTPYYFYFMNYYDSLCMAPREAHLDHPYVSRDIPAGLSFQDWQFSIETMAAGWTHLNAPDTIIFKRRRDESLVTESRARRSLVRQVAAMAIDTVGGLGGKVATPPPPQTTKAGFLARALEAVLPRGATDPGPRFEPTSALPHYGPIFAQRIDRARQRQGHAPNKQVYDTVKQSFDHAFYLSRYPDILGQEEIDPVAHYLRAGAEEGRDPSPYFSTRTYQQQTPTLAKSGENPFYHWLTKGRQACPVSPVLPEFDTISRLTGHSPEQAFDLWKSRYDDLRTRFEGGALGEQVTIAAHVEPLVEGGWPAALQVKVPPFHTVDPMRRIASLWRLQSAVGHRRARFVLCVNRARFGSAPRVEGHLARVLAETFGADQVIVVSTDKAGEMPDGKFPAGVRHVDFASLVSEGQADGRQRVLAEFLRSLHPDAVVNINSRLLWDTMTPYGSALAAAMDVHAVLLCNERNEAGHWTGYALRRFYRHFDQLTSVLTDSVALSQELRDRYLLTGDQAQKLRVLPAPVDTTIPIASAPDTVPERRPQIFWAGRLDPQKRVDLLFAIASAMPDCDFRMWGDVVMGSTEALPPQPANVIRKPAYARFSDLPVHEADLFLYTSAWDGVPTILLEIAMTGLPLIGSDVGGTGEILRTGMSRPISQDATPQVWVTAIRDVLMDGQTARADALRLRNLLLIERSKDQHASVVLDVFGADKEPKK